MECICVCAHACERFKQRIVLVNYQKIDSLNHYVCVSCSVVLNSAIPWSPCSSVHEIPRAILEWVAIFFSRGSSLPRNLGLLVTLLEANIATQRRWSIIFPKHCLFLGSKNLPVLAQGNAGSCCTLSPSHFRNIFCSLFNCLKPPRQNVFSKHWYCSRRGHRLLDHCWVFYAAVVQHQAKHICVLCCYFNLEAAHTLNTFWSQHWSWTRIYT